MVAKSLVHIGFDELGATLIARLCCFQDVLAQGAPSSPVLSNICFSQYDALLSEIAEKYSVRLTRYADDIVFSGSGEFPSALKGDVYSLFAVGPWSLSEQKTKLSILPQRLKVHGLLVHGSKVRLTKGYRNRLRAYEHLLALGRITSESMDSVKGHLGYKRQVEKRV